MPATTCEWCHHPWHDGECWCYCLEATDDPEPDPVSCCPACGDPIDYCQGHGEIGDPAGRAILDAHDDGDHSQCHPEGCAYSLR